MAHIHITLVGGQPMPVYNGIVAMHPDKVLFIYSTDSEGQMKAIRAEIAIPIIEQPPLDPTNPQKIIARAQQIAEKYKDEIISINISGGLKSWSHLFARVFDILPNASIIYIDQNNKLWNYKTMRHETTVDFDMDVSFRLQGNPLKHNIPISAFTNEDNAVLKKLVNARNYNCGRFNQLTTILTKSWENTFANQRTGCLELDAENYVEWEKPDFVRLTLGTNKYGIQEFVFESPNAVHLCFHAGWFEYKIARMLSNWKYAKDIRLNCIFPPKRNPDIRFPKNEIDIIVNTGSKLLFVECKTVISSSTDIDKFRTAVKNYGGMGSKALFVTDNIMTDMQKEKCKESGIIVFSLKDNSFGSDKEQALFKLLEQALFNINTK